MSVRFAAVLFLAVWGYGSAGLPTALAQQDPFQAAIRPTDPLTPEQERASFQLPEGFRIDLVAAEPDILKPMNLAFDARGRLWVTMSREYPYAAPPDRPPRDLLKILEDTDGDGRADKTTTFADGLNIPIGVYPYRRGAIVFSIPHIWYLEDTDGDDVADRRTRLYGPMGFERDTHGMNNAFRRGYDGWLYACHGFNNETRVAGADGHEIHMQSGNTYRMRTDGARIEHFTWGQVNPFGMTIDRRFNLFTADCHSKPIYQLIREGYYPSFGKPDDGLGFVPPMMDHLHGSTAIAGVCYYAAEQFPPPFRDNLFSGNVMTSRINRNSLILHGSTMRCQEQDDFVKTTDPWFRPVDVCLGPDGALYVADFYNRIIGHYEVPLDHPGRDRTSGRIWRISWSPDGKPLRLPRFDISACSAEELIEYLADANLTRRLLALDALSDRIGTAAVAPLQAATRHPSPDVRALAWWGLFRLGAVTADALAPAVADDEPLVRLHAVKVAAELPDWNRELYLRVAASLEDTDAFVRRAAADALGQHPREKAIPRLLSALESTDPADALLRHNLRIALRNQLQASPEELLAPAAVTSATRRKEIASICRAIPTAAAAQFLLDYLRTDEVTAAEAAAFVRHAAAHAKQEQIPALIQIARARFGDQLDLQLELLANIRQGWARHQNEVPPELVAWARELAEGLSKRLPDGPAAWTNHPVAGAQRTDNPWVVQTRPSADGVTAPFLCSLPRGEQLTGQLRSVSFAAPAQLSFFLAGHSGFPDKPLNRKNAVRLRDAATREILQQTWPPRNDTAQRVTWNLERIAGRSVYFEIVDEDEAGAYAWLAVGRFEPPIIRVPDESPADVAARQFTLAGLVRDFALRDFESLPRKWLNEVNLEPMVQGAAAEAWLALHPRPAADWIVLAIGDAGIPNDLRQESCRALISPSPMAHTELAARLMKAAPARLQQRIAVAMSATRSGLYLLVELAEKGQASPRLLRMASVEQRWRAARDADLESRILACTANLPEPREEIERLIELGRHEFSRGTRNPERGKEVFKKSCAACHQIAGQGAVVGPQLDGIGNRGLERLLEDLLDPNRNVDVAFRTTSLLLDDGKVVTGLLREEQGDLLVLVDEKGQSFTVPKGRVEEQSKSTLSLMPENIATSLPPADFLDLIAYLLTQRAH